jgi:hypothetical protein
LSGGERLHRLGWVLTVLCSTCVLPGQYHGGGGEAILEPISEHLLEYEFVLATYFGTGTQAAYRGKRLYDPASPASKALVTKWVSFFKEHRVILNADIVHVAR